MLLPQFFKPTSSAFMVLEISCIKLNNPMEKKSLEKNILWPTNKREQGNGILDISSLHFYLASVHQTI